MADNSRPRHNRFQLYRPCAEGAQDWKRGPAGVAPAERRSVMVLHALSWGGSNDPL